MGNTIKPHIERAEKSGACQLCGMGITEVNVSTVHTLSLLFVYKQGVPKMLSVSGPIY
jgi:hypothetical protein